MGHEGEQMTITEAKSIAGSDVRATTKSGVEVWVYRVADNGLARVRYCKSDRLADIPVENLNG